MRWTYLFPLCEKQVFSEQPVEWSARCVDKNHTEHCCGQ